MALISSSKSPNFHLQALFLAIYYDYIAEFVEFLNVFLTLSTLEVNTYIPENTIEYNLNRRYRDINFHITKLTALAINSEYIYDEFITLLFDSEKKYYMSLERVRIYPKISDIGAIAIANILRGSRIHSLFLGYHLTNIGAEAILKQLQYTDCYLHTLVLTRNLTEDIPHLFSYLNGSNLTTFELHPQRESIETMNISQTEPTDDVNIASADGTSILDRTSYYCSDIHSNKNYLLINKIRKFLKIQQELSKNNIYCFDNYAYDDLLRDRFFDSDIIICSMKRFVTAFPIEVQRCFPSEIWNLIVPYFLPTLLDSHLLNSNNHVFRISEYMIILFNEKMENFIQKLQRHQPKTNIIYQFNYDISEEFDTEAECYHESIQYAS